MVGEPAAADQEQLQDGLPHWTRLGRVLPAGLPRPGLRGGPAQRGPAGGGVVLSEGDDGGARDSGSRAISGDYTVNAELPVVGSPIRQEPT